MVQPPAGLPLRLIRGEPELKMLMADERPARPGDGAGLLLCEARSEMQMPDVIQAIVAVGL